MTVRFRATPGFDQRFRIDDREMAKVARLTAEAVRQATPEERGLARKGIRADGPRVISTYPFAHIVEYGSVHSPPYAPFRRGIRAVGLRLDESRL